MKSICQVINREIGRLVKGKIYWFCMLIAPLLSAGFFISLMYEGLPENLPIALVDRDNSSTSRNLARQLDAFQTSSITSQYTDFEAARKAMQRGEVYGIYYIPEGFTRDAATGKEPKISFYTNNSFLIAGSLLFRDMKTVSTLASGSVALQMGRAKGYSDKQIMAQVQPIVIDARPIGNPWLNYSVYLNNIILPGILALLVMCVTVYSIGIEIKEKTARKWLEIGGNSITKCLTGKIIPQTLIFFLTGLLTFIFLYLFIGFPMNHLIPMIVALLFLIIASQALGVFMIGCFPTLRLGLSFACIWGMLAFSASGFSFPVDAMYSFVQPLTNLFPLRHYFLIYVDQALNARDIFYSMPQYLSLLAFLALPFLTMYPLKMAIIKQRYQP
ncbi:ABC transporter permease [Bacteroidales bacterium OttesenSCG-928-A17]|nr:ABC transporter permease [Bacteroidales bacterium OttesenSCG-928-A17]